MVGETERGRREGKGLERRRREEEGVMNIDKFGHNNFMSVALAVPELASLEPVCSRSGR